ncbi:ATP-binding protein [Streptomyces sp. NPDC002536]
MDNPHLHPRPAPIPFTEPWEYELAFPRDPRGPGIARITLRAVLAAHGLHELADRAELLTSELATNSVRYSRGPAAVRLTWAHPVLRVSVTDTGAHLPVPVSPSPDTGSGSGRGLLILDLVAHRWGGFPLGRSPLGTLGKIIWFELVLDPGSPPPGAVPALAA